jgi:hypothetical protein
VVEDVQGDDCVERSALDLDLREAGVDEPGSRRAFPRASHLLGGDVDSHQVRPLREKARGTDARPGPALEHVGAVG